MYLLCIFYVSPPCIFTKSYHICKTIWCHISTPTVALACATGGPHRGGSSRRGTLRVWLRALRPQPVIVNHTQTMRITQLAHAHQAPAHTCAPVVFVPRSPARTHGKHTQLMLGSQSFCDLVFILRSPARAHDLGCSKTPEVDCVDLSHAPHKTVAQWNNANGIYTAPRSARDTADGWCSKTPKDGRRELHCSMARGIGTG